MLICISTVGDQAVPDVQCPSRRERLLRAEFITRRTGPSDIPAEGDDVVTQELQGRASRHADGIGFDVPYGEAHWPPLTENRPKWGSSFQRWQSEHVV